MITSTASLERIAARTLDYPYKAWGFGEAIAMLGLLGAWRVTGDRRYRRFVEDQFDRWHVTGGEDAVYADHVAPGVPLLMLARGDARRMEAALSLGRLFTTFPTMSGLPIHRPDLAPWTQHVWVDCLYTDGPFLALLARMTGDEAWQNRAVEHALAYANTLVDPQTGLFFHGFDAGSGRPNAVRWGRGNCWALLGLVDLLRFLRADHPARGGLVSIVERQIAAIVRLQHKDGHWHTVLDREDTYLEHSIAAMLAWAIPQATRIGLLGDAALRNSALAAARALSRQRSLRSTRPAPLQECRPRPQPVS